MLGDVGWWGVVMDGGGGKQDGPKKSENKAPQCSKHMESIKEIDFEQIWKNHFLVIFVVDTGIFFVVDTGGWWSILDI